MVPDQQDLAERLRSKIIGVINQIDSYDQSQSTGIWKRRRALIRKSMETLLRQLDLTKSSGEAQRIAGEISSVFRALSDEGVWPTPQEQHVVSLLLDIQSIAQRAINTGTSQI